MNDPLMGRYASVKIGSTVIENLGKWVLDIKTNEIDVSVFGSVWGKKIPGQQAWTATIDGFYDPADAAGQANLQADMLAGTKITDIKLFINSTSSWEPDITTDTNAGCYVTGLNIAHDKAGVAAISMTIVGFGPIKLV